MMIKKFSSSYFLRLISGDFNPFTPNVISIDDSNIEYRRRNWHLISVDTESLHFQNITGISVDKHLFGATLKIKSKGNDSILIHGFWKTKANEIKDICFKQMSTNTQRGSNEVIKDAVSKGISQASSSGAVSVADELMKLKELLDIGVLSQKEFDEQKKIVMK